MTNSNLEEKKSQIVELKTLFEEFKKKFFESFPQYEDDLLKGVGDEICELAIKIQSLSYLLGENALKRLNYVGLKELVCFDNVTDFYSFRKHIVDNRINVSHYLTIDAKVYAELQRIEFFIDQGNWDNYQTLEIDFNSTDFNTQSE